MDAKEAIRKAKGYVADVFGDEGVFNIGLEELTFDKPRKTWNVTVGFSRKWDNVQSPFAVIAAAPPRYLRTYKVVDVSDADGQVRGVRNRSVSDEAA